MKTEEKKDIVRRKCNFFNNKSKPIHIKLKNKFYNGFIREIRADFFVVNDFFVGLVPIFYVEVVELVEYKEMNKKENG
jgi:hypothetical protein